MPAHPNAYAHLAERLRRTKETSARDELLDTWLDYRNHATDWDADQWDLNPDQWGEEQP